MIEKFKKIYDLSPICLQNIMTTIYGLKTRKERYQKEYYYHLKKIEILHSLSREELYNYQFEEMISLLRNTIDKSNYYRELYIDIDIDKFTSIEDIKQLPIVDKEMIRKNIDNILTIDKKNGLKSSTGGTTGKSLVVYNDSKDMQKRMAVLDYFKKINGFENMNMKRATFMGKSIVPIGQKKKVYWRYNAAIKQMVYSSFHITEENIPYYIESLNKFKPKSIDGFPSSIYDIAEYMIRKNIKLDFVPIAIFPTAETITMEYREIIEKAFGSKVRDQYASSEGAPFIYQCNQGNYHYDITTGIIEHIENSNEILVTSFLNYGTPVIRYAIGDSIVFEEENKQCTCGFSTPLIKKIEGRSLDYLYTVDGAKINLGNLSNIIKGFPNNVIKTKFIQKKVEDLEIKVVLDGELTGKDINLIEKEVRYRFGESIYLTIEKVDSLSVEKSGKYRMIENYVK